MLTARFVACSVAILAHSRIKLKEEQVCICAADELLVYAPDRHRDKLLFALQHLLTILPKVGLALFC
jgi:hypothetical protein